MRNLAMNEIEMVAAGNGGNAVATLVVGVIAVGVLSAIFSGRNCRWENVPHTKVNPVYDPYTGAHIQNQIIDYTTPEWICR